MRSAHETPLSSADSNGTATPTHSRSHTPPRREQANPLPHAGHVLGHTMEETPSAAAAAAAATAGPHTPTSFPPSCENAWREASRPSSPRAAAPSKRLTDPRRSSTVSLRQQHGQTFRLRWHHHESRSAGPRVDQVGGRHVSPSRGLPPASPPSRLRVVVEMEQALPKDADAGKVGQEKSTLHRYLKGWYSTLLRSHHARQAEQLMAVYEAQSLTVATEEQRKRDEVDAAVRRACGYTTKQPTTNALYTTAHDCFAPARGPPCAPGAALDESSPLLLTRSSQQPQPPPPSLDPSVQGPAKQKTESETGGRPNQSLLHRRLLQALPSFLRGALLAASYRELVGLWGCVVMVLSGNALQVIALNFWLRQYPMSNGAPGNYTTLAISSAMFSIFFLAVLGVYLVMERPDMRFLWHKNGAKLLLAVGMSDLACSCLTIYAASHTSEILQALFTSTAPIFTAAFQKRILRDPRQYGNGLVVTAFVCIVTGVVVASSYGFVHPLLVVRQGSPDIHVTAAAAAPVSELPHWQNLVWSVLFFCSVIPSVVQNVVQTKYMLYFTRDALFERWVITRAMDAGGLGSMVSGPDALTESTSHDGAGDVCPACGRAASLLLPAMSPTSSSTPPYTERQGERVGQKRHGSYGESDPCLAETSFLLPPTGTPPPSSMWLLRRHDPAALSAGKTPTTQPPSTTLAEREDTLLLPPPSLTRVVDEKDNAVHTETQAPTRLSFDFVNAITYQSPVIRPVYPGIVRFLADSDLGEVNAEDSCQTSPTPKLAAAGSLSHRQPHRHRSQNEREVGSSEGYGTFSPGRSANAPPSVTSSSGSPAASAVLDGSSACLSPRRVDVVPTAPTAPSVVMRLGDSVSAAGDASSACANPCNCTRIWMGYGHVVPGEDLTVKLVLLAADTTIQAVGALLLLPADALPFWGGSKTVREAAEHFEQGLSCVLYCEKNLTFGFLYCMGFVFMYIGGVYLDQYSVTLCSMVTQLAAPCTALLLIAYPSLNLTGDYTPWWLSCIAIVFLITGTVLFTLWDQRTTEEKLQGENEVKRDYVKPFLVVEKDGEVTAEFPVLSSL